MDNSVLATQAHLISCQSLRTIKLSDKKLHHRAKYLHPDKKFIHNFFIKLKAKIEANALHQSQLAQQKSDNKEHVTSIILEVLLARKYRSGKREEADPQAIYKKIKYFVDKNEPVKLYISMFPCKIPNPLKTSGPMPDLAEIISIARLIEICAVIKTVYKPGATFTILPDGRRFLKIARFPLETVTTYQNQLMRIAKDLGGEDTIFCLDYADLLDMLTPKEKSHMEVLKEKYYEEYKQKYGLLSEDIPFSKIKKHIREHEQKMHLDKLSHKFFALFHSLLYTIYHKEIMELDKKTRDILALKVYDHLFSDSDNAEVASLRSIILARSWNAAIAYITNISAIRELSPAEKIVSRSIRFDMHNIPGRIGLYTLYRSTKYTPFHTSGYIDGNGEMKVDFRVNLENEDFVKVSGGNYSHAYGTQPIMYLHKSLVRAFEKNPEEFLNYISFRS